MSRPYPCVYCTEDGYCKKFSDKEMPSWCVFGPCIAETPSNADRVRAMTDEELADFLGSIIHGYGQGIAEIEGADYLIDDWLDWLKEEGEG